MCTERCPFCVDKECEYLQQVVEGCITVHVVPRPTQQVNVGITFALLAADLRG